MNFQQLRTFRELTMRGFSLSAMASVSQLTAHRDIAAARRFFDKAIRGSGTSEKFAMDKSGANKAAIDEINNDIAVSITVRQTNYLNNIVEQDHRAIKRMTRPMLGFKSFHAAARVLAGIENRSTLPSLGVCSACSLTFTCSSKLSAASER